MSTFSQLFLVGVLISSFLNINSSSSFARIDSDDGGYERVVVAVSPLIDEELGHDLVQIIQEFFASLSQRLHSVTQNGTYFKSVNILVPSEWTFTKTNWSSFETFEGSDFRIQEQNESVLQVEQPGGCGEQGDFVSVSNQFILDWNLSRNASDDSENRLVNIALQQWMRYRFGVFEESGRNDSKRFPSQFWNSGVGHVTGCSSPDAWRIRQNTNCTWEDVFNQRCQFNQKENAVFNSSFMDPNIEGEALCDDTEDRKHVASAPTPHNALCSERSVWDVISSHPDFQEWTEKINVSQPQQPVFQIVRTAPLVAVLVIDPLMCAEKVEDTPTYRLLRRQFVELLPQEFTLGFVIADGKKVVDFIETHKDILNEVKGLCRNADAGNVNMSKAIEKAHEMLEARVRNNRKVIFVMSDGSFSNNTVASLPAVFDLLQSDSSLTTYFFVYPAVNEFNDTFSTWNNYISRFRWYNIPKENTETSSQCDLNALARAEESFSDAISRYIHFLPKKTVVYSRSHANSSFSKGNFVVDFPANIHIAVFACFSPDDVEIATVKLKLDNSTNGIFLEGQHIFRADPFNVKEPHNYTYVIEPYPDTATSIIVSVKPDSSQLMPVISTHISQLKLNKNEDLNVVAIRAGIKLERRPLLEITVEAIIARPDSSIVKLQLFDNGNGNPDTFKDDGIYSRYFTQFTNISGMYHVTIILKTNPSITTRNVTLPFHITSPSETFFFKGIADENEDIFPPNQILDFVVLQLHKNEGIVTLSWTAPGDDLDFGKASDYLFKCTQNGSRSDLLDFQTFMNFSTTSKLKPPAEAMTTETFNWTTFPCDVINLCSLAAVDKSRKTSRPSNVVSVYLPCLPPAPPPTTTVGTTTKVSYENTSLAEKDEPAGGLTKDEIYFISGAVSVTLLIIIVLLVAVLICRKKKHDQTRNWQEVGDGRNSNRIGSSKGNGYHVDIIRHSPRDDLRNDDFDNWANDDPQPQPPTQTQKNTRARTRNASVYPRNIACISSSIRENSIGEQSDLEGRPSIYRSPHETFRREDPEFTRRKRVAPPPPPPRTDSSYRYLAQYGPESTTGSREMLVTEREKPPVLASPIYDTMYPNAEQPVYPNTESPPVTSLYIGGNVNPSITDNWTEVETLV